MNEETGTKFKEELRLLWRRTVRFLKKLWRGIKETFKKWFGPHKDQDGELFVERKKLRPFPVAIVFTTLKITAVIVVLAGCAALGAGLGVAKAYVETTPDLDVSQLTKSDRTSYIYDKDGDLITTYAGMEYRDWVDIEEVPDMLKNALIAIEDVRFYKHEGVDYKRLISAVINTFTNQNSHGGSTLTQQLIKNKILSNEQSYKRKIKEAYLALEVEKLISKDDILEAYMNDVFLGGSNYGIKTAAKDYFGKELGTLTVRECAMLAGMVQKPYETNPRANLYSRELDEARLVSLENAYESDSITESQYNRSLSGKNCMYITDRRTNVVLLAMYNAGFITKEQYDSAMAETVSVLEISKQKQIYDMPYFVEYAIRDVVTHMLEQRGLLDTNANRSAVENELRTGGYEIYLTVDTDMQHLVQDTLTNWEEYPELADPTAAVKVTTGADGTPQEVIQPQAAAVVLDYHTGELRAIVGGRTTPERKKEWNRAYQSATPVGSSIKPIAVYGPALDMGASPATVLYNFEAPIQGWNTEKGYPAIGSSKWIGPITIRRGVISSLNVAAARTLYEHVGIEKSTEYLTNLGVDPANINPDGPGLALGTTGITPIQMAAAYGTIGSGGVYKEPLAFTRVINNEGKIVLDANEVRKTRTVFRTSTTYMLVDILQDAVKRGTGTAAKIDGITVAGKTGTNSDYSSVYFAGITPYYTATVWIGHDDYAQKLQNKSTGGDYAAPLWQAFMSKIHEGLTDKPIIDGSPSEMGLVKRTVCSVSGKLATEACAADELHAPVTDWFEESTAPTEVCDMHALYGVCSISGQAASAYCPQEYVSYQSVVLIHTDSPYMQFDPVMLKQYITNAVYTNMTSDEYAIQSTLANSSLCSVHTPGSYVDSYELTALVSRSNELITTVQTYLDNVQELSDTDRATLENELEWLKYYVSVSESAQISSFYERLSYNYTVISQANPPVAAP